MPKASTASTKKKRDLEHATKEGKTLSLARTMDWLSPVNAWNRDYIDQMYQEWKTHPKQLPEVWQSFFEGFQLAQQNTQSQSH
ncbi:MAG: hypothetical protein AAGJ35_08860, partial [Myxococcota bacterium]